MECKDYQDLLIQFLYEEISPEERVLLESHLKNCEKCTVELERNKQLFKLTRKLRTTIPKDEKKENTINSIFKEINAFQKIRHPQIISYRTLRIIINAAAVFLIGLFLIQQMQIKRNLKDLKVRIELQDYPDTKDIRANEIDIVSFLDNPKLLEKLEITEEEVLELIDSYRSIQEEKSTILNYLRINHPEVYKELQRTLKECKYPTHKL